jgi:hypothetical protein
VYLVQWGDEYWISANEIDGGSGSLHETLAPTRELLRDSPRLGHLIDPGRDLYVTRVTIVAGLLVVVVIYQVNEPFVNLLKVKVLPE